MELAQGFEGVVPTDPVSNEFETQLLAWLTGLAPAIDPSDDAVDSLNPIPRDEQRFYNLRKRRSATRSSIDLQRQVFSETVDDDGKILSRPAQTPYHHVDNCQKVP